MVAPQHLAATDAILVTGSPQAYEQAIAASRSLQGVADVLQITKAEGELGRARSAAVEGRARGYTSFAGEVPDARRVLEARPGPEAGPDRPAPGTAQPYDALNDILANEEAGALNVGAVRDFLRGTSRAKATSPRRQVVDATTARGRA